MAQPQNCNNNAVNDGRNVEDDPQLPMVKVDQEHVDSGAQCTTCLETFHLDEDVAQLKCQHIFHRTCIQSWLQRNNTCPICRAKVEWRREGIVNMEHHDLEAGEWLAYEMSDSGEDEDEDEEEDEDWDQIRQVVDNFEERNRQAIANVEMAGQVIDNHTSLFTGN